MPNQPRSAALTRLVTISFLTVSQSPQMFECAEIISLIVNASFCDHPSFLKDAHAVFLQVHLQVLVLLSL